MNDYHEARGEHLVGRVAVAYVVLNRTRDRRWPMDICAVVRQINKRGICQFSWTCSPYANTPEDKFAWENSKKLAIAMLDKEQKIVDPTNGALWYHTLQVNPKWRLSLRPRLVVGNHIFYKDKRK